jgi:Mrp family chromosome partitioning ATPase
MKTGEQNSFLLEPNENNRIGKVIGIVSGKGGVGKSLVTSILSVLMQRAGKKVGIMDADITGPSIPKMFGLTENATSSELGIIPQKTSTGLSVISINLLLGKEDSPVIWRGPILSGVVKQFWTDVLWGDLDFLFVDLPPGTGDVPLTVFQSLPLAGIVIVTSPQELVQMIVRKAYNMAQSMQIPVLGLVENMSYLACPDCGKQIKVFGESNLDQVAKELDLKILGRLPLDPALAQLCDQGEIENLDLTALDGAISTLLKV